MSSQLTQRDSLETESELSSFQSALTLLSFVLPDRVAALQNDNDVGLRTNFAAADCGGVPVNWRRCLAVLFGAWDSFRFGLGFFDRIGADLANQFFEIGGERLGC